LKLADDLQARAALVGNLNDESAVVRGAAVWALKQGLSAEDFANMRSEYLQNETEETVKTEWGQDG
jgi:epoxyqueuosine reductase